MGANRGMSSTQNLLGGRYQYIQGLNSHPAGRTFLAADIHYPGHPKCVIRQLRLPTRNPMTREFILSLLRKKVAVLEEIGKHPQIPSTFAAFDAGQNFFIVQEYIPGRSLRDEIAPGNPWSSARVLALLRDVLPVIDFAHHHGMVHGNLKPSKIIRHRTDNHWALLDFGAIRSISQNISNKESLGSADDIAPATRIYLSPEQFSQKSAQPRSDYFALGMIAVQLLTGLAPEDLPTAQQPDHPEIIAALLEKVPGLEQSMATLIKRMVHTQADQRHHTVDEMLGEMPHAASNGAVVDVSSPASPAPNQPESTPTVAPSSKPKGWRRAAWVGLVGCLAIGALMGLRVPQRLLARQHFLKAETLAMDDPTGAIAGYTASIEQLPTHHQALAGRSRLYFDQGETESALADITRAIALDPDEPSYHYDRGNFRFAVGDLQGAIDDYTEAVRQAPNFAKAYVNRGSARAEWGDDQGAIDDYTRAIDLTQNVEAKAAAYLNRCLSYSNIDEQMAALADCSTAINLQPSHALAYQNRGLVRRRLQEYQGSLQDYNIAIQIDPNIPDPYYNRALTRRALDDLSGAMEDFDKAIALAPNYAFAVYDRGMLHAELGNVEAAKADLAKASELCLDLGRTGCFDDAQYQLSRLELASATGDPPAVGEESGDRPQSVE